MNTPLDQQNAVAPEVISAYLFKTMEEEAPKEVASELIKLLDDASPKSWRLGRKVIGSNDSNG